MDLDEADRAGGEGATFLVGDTHVGSDRHADRAGPAAGHRERVDRHRAGSFRKRVGLDEGHAGRLPEVRVSGQGEGGTPDPGKTQPLSRLTRRAAGTCERCDHGGGKVNPRRLGALRDLPEATSIEGTDYGRAARQHDGQDVHHLGLDRVELGHDVTPVARAEAEVAGDPGGGEEELPLSEGHELESPGRPPGSADDGRLVDRVDLHTRQRLIEWCHARVPGSSDADAAWVADGKVADEHRNGTLGSLASGSLASGPGTLRRARPGARSSHRDEFAIVTEDVGKTETGRRPEQLGLGAVRVERCDGDAGGKSAQVLTDEVDRRRQAETDSHPGHGACNSAGLATDDLGLVDLPCQTLLPRLSSGSDLAPGDPAIAALVAEGDGIWRHVRPLRNDQRDRSRCGAGTAVCPPRVLGRTDGTDHRVNFSSKRTSSCVRSHGCTVHSQVHNVRGDG
ncbi:MAG: hypothetical protein ABSH30_14140 [Acidimicrobiales bacterium]